MLKIIFKPKNYFFNSIAFYPWMGFVFFIMTIIGISFSKNMPFLIRFFPLIVGFLMYMINYRDLRESSTEIILDDHGIERIGLFGKKIKAKWEEIEWIQEYVYQYLEIKLIVQTKHGKIHIPSIVQKYDELVEIIRSHNIPEKEAKVEGAKTVKLLFRLVLIISGLIIISLFILALIRGSWQPK